MPDWQHNDPDSDDGWASQAQPSRRPDRRSYSDFTTFTGYFRTWPDGSEDPDFLIHYIPQTLGRIQALAIPIAMCSTTSWDGRTQWHYNPDDIVCNAVRLAPGIDRAIGAAIREYMEWRATTPIPPPKPTPANIGAPIWHF